MEVLRNIGRHDVLIDTAEPCGISLSTQLLTEHNLKTTDLTKKQILGMLASGDDYFPLSMQWEVLDGCNFRCPFCYIVGHSEARLVRFSDIKHHLYDFIDQGLLFCTLTGGEVTLHPDFVEIYCFLREAGVIVDVFTNGSVLTDDILDAYAKYPPRMLEVSVYSLSDTKIKDVCGIRMECVASRVKKHILQLHRLGYRVVCKTFINALTQDEADQIISWCEDQGLEYYSSMQMTQAYDGSDLSEFRVNGAAQNLHVLQEGESNIAMPCGTRNYGAHLNAHMQMNPCPAIRLPESFFSVLDLGVSECVVQVKRFIRKHESISISKSCTNQISCASCIAYATPVRGKGGTIIDLLEPIRLVKNNL